jgi:undecaprenyl-diphosphatase
VEDFSVQNWLFDIRSRTFFLFVLSFLVLVYVAVAKIVFTSDTSFENYLKTLSGNVTVDLTMQVFSELGWILYPILISIILFIIRKTRRLGLILLLSLLVGSMAAAYMRCYTGYEKPDLQFLGVHLAITSGADIGVPCKIEGTFPAGHTVRTTTFAFIIGYALSRRFPRGCYLIWLYPVLVSISRLYLLQEYPTTIIAGVIFGVLVANTVSKKLKIDVIFDRSKI